MVLSCGLLHIIRANAAGTGKMTEKLARELYVVEAVATVLSCNFLRL